MQAREAELLAAHEREWLGELADHLPGDGDEPNEHWWARGFVSELRTPRLTRELARALAVAPAARLLRTLRIEEAASVSEPTYTELIGGTCLGNLRVLEVGKAMAPSDDPYTDGSGYTPELERLVECMPRVEELQLLCDGYDARALFALPNLERLQVLRIVGLAPPPGLPEETLPLDALARNAALGNLTHLLVHPASTAGLPFVPLARVAELVNSRHLTSLTHLQLRLSDMGDDGAHAIVGSGVLKRLGWLDLRNGTMTDYAARAFAVCAAAKGLRRLDLSRNAITHAGLNLLKRAGVNAVANNVPSPREQQLLDARLREEDARDDDME